MEKKFDMRERRKELGLTLEEVAAKAGLTSSAVRQMEVGAFKGQFMTRHKVADALGVPVRYLMSEDERTVFAEAMRHAARDEREAKRARSATAAPAK